MSNRPPTVSFCRSFVCYLLCAAAASVTDVQRVAFGFAGSRNNSGLNIVVSEGGKLLSINDQSAGAANLNLVALTGAGLCNYGLPSTGIVTGSRNNFNFFMSANRAIINIHALAGASRSKTLISLKNIRMVNHINGIVLIVATTLATSMFGVSD